MPMNAIAMHAEVTIAGVVRQLSGLQHALEVAQSEGAIQLDLGRVRAFDGAGLQLLLSLWHTAAENGCDVVLHNTPPCVATVLEELDVADRFKFGDGATGIKGN